MREDDEDDDDGLPDDAFTETELKAGVQHLMRSKPRHPSQSPHANDDRQLSTGSDQTLPQMRFTTFPEAVAWSQSHPGHAFTRSPDGQGFVLCKPAPARRRSRALRDAASSVWNFDSDWVGVFGGKERDYWRELLAISPYLHSALRDGNWVSPSKFAPDIAKLTRGQTFFLASMLSAHLDNELLCLELIYEQGERGMRLKGTELAEHEPTIENLERVISMINAFLAEPE
ncbi:hypothetical protein [Piscinibacter sakaiensis]|uniref:hypothetical protein n=1 Tax=Piscinibacter sakaiensis TaxID=1547922 RepID=UPI003AAEFFA7